MTMGVMFSRFLPSRAKPAIRNRHARAAPVMGSFIRRISSRLSSSTSAAFSSAAPTPPMAMGSVMSPASLVWIRHSPVSREALGWAITAHSSSSPASASSIHSRWFSKRAPRLVVSSTISRPPISFI